MVCRLSLFGVGCLSLFVVVCGCLWQFVVAWWRLLCADVVVVVRCCLLYVIVVCGLLVLIVGCCWCVLFGLCCLLLVVGVCCCALMLVAV